MTKPKTPRTLVDALADLALTVEAIDERIDDLHSALRELAIRVGELELAPRPRLVRPLGRPSRTRSSGDPGDLKPVG